MPIVYLLTHEAMPGLTKIGRTDGSIEDRLRQLNNTSVPFGFTCFYAAEVLDSADVERRLHDAFDDSCYGKEFFEIHPMRAQRVLEMAAIADRTPRDELIVDEIEKRAIERIDQREHLHRFSMERIGLKAGDVLTFARDASITAVVASDSKVTFEGEEKSLTAAALIAIRKCGYNWSRIAGPMYWLHNDKSLKEIERKVLEL